MVKKFILIVISLMICIVFFVINSEDVDNSQINDTYIIDLEKFNIKNDNSEATNTTEGINKALEYAKDLGYKKVVLPEGHYAIDTSVTTEAIIKKDELEWTQHRKGIVLQSGIELIMNDSILEMVATSDPYYSIISITNCDGSKLTGGIILGDREFHDYGERINDNGDDLEYGGIDEKSGFPVDDSSMVRTRKFISNFKGGELPKEFILMCQENTSKNTTDGGVRYIYCYDENEKYLGMAKAEEYNSFWEKAVLIEGTKKIKVAFKDEKRLDAKYYITVDFIYPSHEFASGILITNSENIEINDVTVRNIVGDCVQTMSTPVKSTVDNLKIINSTFENSRRQGISLVATGENYLIKNCNIGKINGVDPQSGIDIENYEYVRSVVIEENNFYDNKKLDIINYNGSEIDIVNNNFTGGIGVTYGYNMNINNNKFIYSDPEWLDKTHKGWAICPNMVKGTYFYIIDNYFEGYNVGGVGVQSSNVEDSLFTGNKIVNSVCRIFGNSYGNVYENSEVRYVSPIEFRNETLKDSKLCGENNGNKTIDRVYYEFNLINTEFEGGNNSFNDTILYKCNIYSNNKTFCNTWSGKYTVKESIITTEYESKIPFINEQGCDIATFINCTMNISCTPFVYANYKEFNLINCEITFNESYKSDENIEVFNTGNFINNIYYKDFDFPKISIPKSENSKINDIEFIIYQE